MMHIYSFLVKNILCICVTITLHWYRLQILRIVHVRVSTDYRVGKVKKHIESYGVTAPITK